MRYLAKITIKVPKIITVSHRIETKMPIKEKIRGLNHRQSIIFPCLRVRLRYASGKKCLHKKNEAERSAPFFLLLQFTTIYPVMTGCSGSFKRLPNYRVLFYVFYTRKPLFVQLAALSVVSFPRE